MMDKRTEKAIKEGRVISVLDSCGVLSWRIYDTYRDAKDELTRAKERGYEAYLVKIAEVKEIQKDRKVA